MDRIRSRIVSLMLSYGVAVSLLLLAACGQTSQPARGLLSPQLPGSLPNEGVGRAPLHSLANVFVEQLEASQRGCGTSSNYGQTFTATVTGEITSIAFAPASNAGTFTTALRVLSGDRTTVLHSQSVTLSESNGALVTITLSAPVPVVAGSVYAFDIGVGCGDGAGLWTSAANTNPYAGGNLFSGNAGFKEDATFRVTISDTAPPSVTINQASGQADPTNASPINFTVVFGEAVTGFVGSDVTLGGTAGATTAVVSGSGPTYNVAVSGMQRSGTVIAAIPADAATDLAGNGNAASTGTDNTVTYVVDGTPPVITPTVTGTLGNNGWYTSNVSVSWTVTDGESGVSSRTGCDASSVTTDTAGVAFTCSATSAGGTDSQSVTIKRDATAPTLAPGVNPNPVLLNGSATATPNASDTLSGIASQSCAGVVTSSVGSKSVTCSAGDNAGNTASAPAPYSVTYAFAGFSSPVDATPTLNVAKAGQAVPLKWRLTDANGAPVTTLTSVNFTVAGLSCAAGTTPDAIEEYASGSSGLQNLGNGSYQFNWKAPKGYADSCKTLKLDLGEGNIHTALFRFK